MSVCIYAKQSGKEYQLYTETSFQCVGIEDVPLYSYRDVLISGGLKEFYCIQRCQMVKIEEFHCIQRYQVVGIEGVPQCLGLEYAYLFNQIQVFLLLSPFLLVSCDPVEILSANWELQSLDQD